MSFLYCALSIRIKCRRLTLNDISNTGDLSLIQLQDLDHGVKVEIITITIIIFITIEENNIILANVQLKSHLKEYKHMVLKHSVSYTDV